VLMLRKRKLPNEYGKQCRTPVPRMVKGERDDDSEVASLLRTVRATTIGGIP
jgi:hypothetical protein